MFSRYYTSEQVRRYQASPYKMRIDRVAGSLVSRRYRDGTVADRVRA